MGFESDSEEMTSRVALINNQNVPAMWNTLVHVAFLCKDLCLTLVSWCTAIIHKCLILLLIFIAVLESWSFEFTRDVSLKCSRGWTAWLAGRQKCGMDHGSSTPTLYTCIKYERSLRDYAYKESFHKTFFPPYFKYTANKTSSSAF